MRTALFYWRYCSLACLRLWPGGSQHKCNRDAIGAEVTLVTAAGSQYATVSTTGSYLSASDKRVHFGMGQERIAQRIEIRWPSGIRQALKDVPADQILQIDEPVAPSTPPKP